MARARLALRVALRCIKRLPYGTGQGRYRPCWRQHLPAGHPASGRTPSKACSRPSGVQSCYTRLPGPTYLAVFGLLQRTGHHPAWVMAFMRPPARRPRPARAPRPARRPSAAPASWLARYDGCTRCHRGRLTVTAAYPRGPEETSGCHSAGAGRAVEGGAAVAGSLAWLTISPHILNKYSKYVMIWDTLYTSSATKARAFAGSLPIPLLCSWL